MCVSVCLRVCLCVCVSVLSLPPSRLNLSQPPSLSPLNLSLDLLYFSEGLAFCLLDLQHGAANLGSAGNMIQAVTGTNRACLVRVLDPGNMADIARALDLGASAAVIPGVSGAEHAQAIADAARLPPQGGATTDNFSNNFKTPLLGTHQACSASLTSLNPCCPSLPNQRARLSVMGRASCQQSAVSD